MHDSGAEDAPKGMTDSGVEDAPKAFTCASDAGPATGTLYERLGGHAGIRAALDAIVAAELANADIASYFFYQSDAGYKEGHPNGDQIEECFTDFVGKAAGGPELYPTTLTADAGNGGAAYTCRELSVAHRDLEINQGTYDEFLGIAAMVLGANGVCGADIATLAGALESTGDGGVASAIITSVKKSDGGEKFPGNVAADLKLDATY